MKTLKLFNAVLAKESKTKPFISEKGFIIEPNAAWAKKQIIDYYDREQLNGNDLNKTFHKSWKKIKDSSRCELLIHQIMHYITTYGNDFTSEIYIPDEVLELPNIKLKYKVIKAYTKDDLVEKCLNLLKSGVALKEETINDLLTVLVDELNYEFTGKEGIKNKEAIIKIADLYGVFPTNTMEFFRYILYRATGQSLLIKNNEVIELIKSTNYNPVSLFNKYGLEKLATIFNRFKPLFLAFKHKCPSTINKIGKLSKKYHKPLIENPLNLVTQRLLTEKTDNKWLDNTTPYALFKALSACYQRVNKQGLFIYRIRNGKSYVTEMNDVNKNLLEINRINFIFLKRYLKNRFNLSDKKIFIPKNVKYALPTSEKMFVGNIPTGTKFYGKKLAVGIYWENSWGAHDLDLSGINVNGKVGWNSIYNQYHGQLMFSGDITSAPNGAVEYLYANKGLDKPTLVQNNVYSGDDNCEYKIIIGKGDKISKQYMMNPENLFMEVKCKSVQKQTILGIFLPEDKKQSFVLLNFGAGHMRVSGNNNITNVAKKALYEQWNNPLSFNKIVKLLGAEIVENVEDSDIDLSLGRSLEKDSFIKLFQEC